MEDQLVRLKEYEQSHMEELKKLNQGNQEAMVFENRYTQYTTETLRVGWEQLLTSINHNINEVENQILTRDSKGMNVQTFLKIIITGNSEQIMTENRLHSFLSFGMTISFFFK